MRRQRVTLRDVARAADTTAMTVSNVLNGRSHAASADTAARVRAVIEQLGYRPNAAGRELRAARRMAIGVVIVDPSPYYLSDPFTAAMLAGLNDRLMRSGYSLILQGVPAPALGTVPILRQIASDGICLVASGSPAERRQILSRIAALGQPVVVIQDEADPALGDVAAVRLDDEAGATAIAQHLGQRPLRHVVLLVPGTDWPAIERREAAVRQVLSRMNVPPSITTVRCGDEGFDETRTALARAIDRHGLPDAIIGGNDRMALAALAVLAERDIAVPARVAVTGFNGLENHHYARPALTTVVAPAFQVGEQAATMLVDRLHTGTFAEQRVLVPVRFHAAHSSTLDMTRGEAS